MSLLTRAKTLLEELRAAYRDSNRGRLVRWGIGAYGAAALACTAAWLVIGPQVAERTGLRQELFLANDFAGRPFRDEVNENISLDFLDDDERLPRRHFSVRWHGYWYVPDGGPVEIHGAGDDWLTVHVDGELVLRRYPPDQMHRAAGMVTIDEGVHHLLIEYEQEAGSYDLDVRWSPPSGRTRPLAGHRLFHERPSMDDVRLAQWAAWLGWGVRFLWLAPLLIAAGLAGFVPVVRTITARYHRRSADQSSYQKRWLRAALVVALGAVSLRALVSRLPGWNPESLWVDDVIFGSLIRSVDLSSLVTIPTHYAPGLFVIWRGFYALFPDPEWSLQILPFASGIAAIPAMAFLGRRLTGDSTLGVLAGAVTAVNPLLAFYTVFVHQYSFEFLLTALFLVAAIGLHSPGTGIDPKRFSRVALCGSVAALFSAPSLFVSFPIVHLGAVLAVWNRRLQRRTARKVLLWSAAYDSTVVAAVLFLRTRSNDAIRESFTPWFMPLDSMSAALEFLMVHGRKAVEMSMPNWTGQGVPEWARPDTASWPLPFIGAGLIWLLWRRQTRFVGFVAAGIYSAVVVGSLLGQYPLGVGRTDVFTFPVGILLFTAGIWCVTEALPRRSAVRLLAATVAVALALFYPVPVSYRPRNDAQLVNHLGVNSQPEDWIMLSFSAGYLSAFYGPWDSRLVPYDTSTGFVATIARDRVLHLPLRLDYDDPSQERAAGGEHRRIVSDFLAEQRPARIWFLAYYTETYNGTNWAPKVIGVLTDNGYRVDRVLEATRGALYVGVMPGVEATIDGRTGAGEIGRGDGWAFHRRPINPSARFTGVLRAGADGRRNDRTAGRRRCELRHGLVRPASPLVARR